MFLLISIMLCLRYHFVPCSHVPWAPQKPIEDVPEAVTMLVTSAGKSTSTSNTIVVASKSTSTSVSTSTSIQVKLLYLGGHEPKQPRITMLSAEDDLSCIMLLSTIFIVVSLFLSTLFIVSLLLFTNLFVLLSAYNCSLFFIQSIC